MKNENSLCFVYIFKVAKAFFSDETRFANFYAFDPFIFYPLHKELNTIFALRNFFFSCKINKCSMEISQYNRNFKRNC